MRLFAVPALNFLGAVTVHVGAERKVRCMVAGRSSRRALQRLKRGRGPQCYWDGRTIRRSGQTSYSPALPTRICRSAAALDTFSRGHFWTIQLRVIRTTSHMFQARLCSERISTAASALSPQCGLRQCRFRPSSSSSVRGQSFPSRRDRLRSASTLPSVWH